MLITRLELTEFRNYESFVIEPSAGLTILVGPNATGKTNAIEAIQIATTGRSFRNPKWADVVRWGSPRSLISLSSAGANSSSLTEIEISSEGRRTLHLNGKTRRSVTEVCGRTPSVVFTPDDLILAKGPAEDRRTMIDSLGEQLSKTYGSIRRDYLKTVRQRNALLREIKTDTAVLEAMNEQLVKLGSSLCVHRRRLLQRVSRPAIEHYGILAHGEALGIRYESRIINDASLEEVVEQTSVEASMREMLLSRRHEELARQTTLVGPHRDDIVFTVGGRDARVFASQGQQRTIALAWKWAEVKTIEDITRKQPVLLLDDVMSELDSTRRIALTGLMQDDIQTFVTTTNIGYFPEDLLKTAHVIEMSRG